MHPQLKCFTHKIYRCNLSHDRLETAALLSPLVVGAHEIVPMLKERAYKFPALMYGLDIANAKSLWMEQKCQTEKDFNEE